MMIRAATGLARSTIGRGLKDLDRPPLAPGCVRRPGSGRRAVVADDPTLLEDLRRLVEAATLGDPVRPLIWVSKSLDKLVAALADQGHFVCPWHEREGQTRYLDAKTLLVTVDCGGSNGARVRLWKRELQQYADETGLTIEVCHYPPGTLKWNRIEHRMFCHVTQTWRGQPLVDRMTVVDLIANTTTKTGLTVSFELDTRPYQNGIKVSDAEMKPEHRRRHIPPGMELRHQTANPQWERLLMQVSLGWWFPPRLNEDDRLRLVACLRRRS